MGRGSACLSRVEVVAAALGSTLFALAAFSSALLVDARWGGVGRGAALCTAGAAGLPFGSSLCVSVALPRRLGRVGRPIGFQEALPPKVVLPDLLQGLLECTAFCPHKGGDALPRLALSRHDLVERRGAWAFQDSFTKQEFFIEALEFPPPFLVGSEAGLVGVG